MSRVFAAAFAVTLAAWTIPVATTPAAADKCVKVVKMNCLNVRKAPNGAIRGKLTNGRKFWVKTFPCDAWCEISRVQGPAVVFSKCPSGTSCAGKPAIAKTTGCAKTSKIQSGSCG